MPVSVPCMANDISSVSGMSVRAPDVNKEAFPGAVPAAAASAALADAGKGAPLDKPALRSALKSKEMAELEEGRAPEGKEVR